MEERSWPGVDTAPDARDRDTSVILDWQMTHRSFLPRNETAEGIRRTGCHAAKFSEIQ